MTNSLNAQGDSLSKALSELIEERYETYKRGKPYGRIRLCYKVNDEDPYVLEPVQEQIIVLEEAFDLLDRNRSYREVAEWLGEKLLINIGHQSVYNAYKRHREPFLKGKVKKKRGRKRSKTHQKKIALKNTINNSQKELDKLNARTAPKKEKVVQDVINATTPNMEQDRQVVFLPNPGPQTEFLASSEQEVLYGGAAGGGKSYALLADPMRYFDNSHFSGLLLRRKLDELRELITKSKQLYPIAFPGAKWREQLKEWSFPSGAKLWMSYLEHDDDVMRYQGQAFNWIAFDELTQYPTPFAWDYLRSRLRTSKESNLPLIQRGTTNPGGPGHHWVKKMFIDPAPPKTPFWATDEEGDIMVHEDKYPMNHPKFPGQPRPDAGQPLFQRKFIPASLYDNPYLMADGNYEASLASLPEAQRKKLLEGNWDIVEGAAFPEFNTYDHVIDPLVVFEDSGGRPPRSWRRFRACDYGYSSHSAVLWFVVEPGTGNLIVYDELYVSKATAKDLAHMIRQKEEDNGSVTYGVLDSSCWHQRGHFGPSIAEEMIAEGVRWRPSDRTKGSRTAGFNRLHELLKVDDQFTHSAGIRFFNTCRNSISQIPALPSDPNGMDDIDEKFPHDHIYDALRYGIMTRPQPYSMDGVAYNSYSASDGGFGY